MIVENEHNIGFENLNFSFWAFIMLKKRCGIFLIFFFKFSTKTFSWFSHWITLIFPKDVSAMQCPFITSCFLHCSYPKHYKTALDSLWKTYYLLLWPKQIGTEASFIWQTFLICLVLWDNELDFFHSLNWIFLPVKFKFKISS